MEPYSVIALAGNPNVGKSTVFNGLTGQRQHTGNWPGKTVATARGYFKVQERRYYLVDLPGTYSLSTHSKEEEIAREYLMSGEPDAVAVVCDATCLERNLNLVLQVIDIGCPVLVIVNLIDEAKKKGITINESWLSELLGVPVITAAARQKKDIKKIAAELDAWLLKVQKTKLHKQDNGQETYFAQAEEICKKVVTVKEPDYLKRDRRIDAILMGKWTAYPFMVLLLAFVLWITIAGANIPSGYLSRFFFWAEKWLNGILTASGAPIWLRGMLLEGVFRVLGWVISVMLPPMAIFFPLFTLLEDAGYLPRIAFNLDRAFERCQACGKQGLTMCMGLGCNAVGVTGCRIIDSPRERLIAIVTNNFMPCNGRFPTLIAVGTLFIFGANAGMGGQAGAAIILTILITGGVIMTFLVSWLLSRTIMRGESSAFTLELPPYRTPQFGKVILRSLLDRTLFVLGRAVVVAAPAGLVIWLMANNDVQGESLLSVCSNFLDPFAALLGLDGVILLAFILGFPANEIVVPIILMAYMEGGGLLDLSNPAELKMILMEQGWDVRTAISMLLFTLFHWPCSTTILTIRKETGSIRWTMAAFFIPTIVGMVACFLFTQMTKFW